MAEISPTQLKIKKPFNFDSSAPRLKILTIVKTADTSPEEKLEIKYEMISTR